MVKTSVIICNILAGGIILDEFGMYGLNQFLFLSGGSLICIMGLLILTKKKRLPTDSNYSMTA